MRNRKLALREGQVAIRGMSERVKRAQGLYRAHATKERPADEFLMNRKAEQAQRDAQLARPESG